MLYLPHIRHTETILCVTPYNSDSANNFRDFCALEDVDPDTPPIGVKYKRSKVWCFVWVSKTKDITFESISNPLDLDPRYDSLCGSIYLHGRADKAIDMFNFMYDLGKAQGP